MRLRNIAFTALLFATLAAQSGQAKDAPLLSLSTEHFRDTATVADDPLAGVTTVATERGYVEHHGLLGAVWSDEFLTGTIDRKTGRRSFELVATITYRGAHHVYSNAKFQGAQGPIAAPVRLLTSSSVNCPTGECTYTDRVSFPLEESLLRALAAKASAGKPELWHYSVAAKSNGAYSGTLSSAEIAGFLAKIDEYTGAAPPPLLHAALRAKPELGIGGLRVEASEQMPLRSGVLVTAVSRGSLAEKAGIIVGDIVREIDGRLITAPADLQTAIGAAQGNAAVVITLFRGTTEMTLKGQLSAD